MSTTTINDFDLGNIDNFLNGRIVDMDIDYDRDGVYDVSIQQQEPRQIMEKHVQEFLDRHMDEWIDPEPSRSERYLHNKARNRGVV
jgi:hypothetical protein